MANQAKTLETAREDRLEAPRGHHRLEGEVEGVVVEVVFQFPVYAPAVVVEMTASLFHRDLLFHPVFRVNICRCTNF